MAMLKIKKGDTVKVIAGKDKDKEGKVIAVDHKNGRVTVEGDVYKRQWQLLISLQITVREHRKLKHVLKFLVVEENHGDRKELVMQDRVQQELHSGQAAE